MKITLAILRGLFTLSIFVIVAMSVKTGFEEIVVGGLTLIYVSISTEVLFISNQVQTSHLGLIRAMIATVDARKDSDLENEVNEARNIIDTAEEKVDEQKIPIDINAMFTILIMVLSIALIIKGAFA